MAESAEFQVIAKVLGQDKLHALAEALEKVEAGALATQQQFEETDPAIQAVRQSFEDTLAASQALLEQTTALGDSYDEMNQAAEAVEDFTVQLTNALEAGDTDKFRELGEQVSILGFETRTLTAEQQKLTAEMAILEDSLNRLTEGSRELSEEGLALVQSRIAAFKEEGLELTPALQKIDDETNNWSDSLDGILGPLDDVVRRVTGFSLAALSTAGVIAGVTLKVISWTKELISLGDELVDLAQRRDVSVGFLQEMKFVADQTGISFHLLTFATQELNRRVASGTPQATEALEKLGFTVKEVMAMDSETRFRAIADALGQVQNSAERAALSNALFGRTGRELANMGPEVAKLSELYRELGLAIDEDVLEAGEDLADNWKILMEMFRKARSEELGPLVKLMATLSNEMRDNAVAAKENGEEADRWAYLWDTSFKRVLTSMSSVMSGWQALREMVAWINEQLENAAAAGETGGGGGGGWGGGGPVVPPPEQKPPGATVAVPTEAELAAMAATAKTNEQLEEGARRLDTTMEKLTETYGEAAVGVASYGYQLAQAEKAAEEAAKKATAASEKSADEQIADAKRLSEAHHKASIEAWEYWNNAYDEMVAESKRQADAIVAQQKEAAEKAFQQAEEYRDMIFAQDEWAMRQREEMEREAAERAKQPMIEAEEKYQKALRLTSELVQALGPLAKTAAGQMIVSMANATVAGLGLVKAVRQIEYAFENLGENAALAIEGVIGFFNAALQGYTALEAATRGGGLRGILGGALSGAQIGAAVGSMIGPLGTGLGAALGAIGGAITGALRGIFGGRDTQDVMEEAGRDLGITLSEEMAQAIFEAGGNIQLFLAELWDMGEFEDDIDRFAEEVGDIFTGLEAGWYSAEEAIGALEAAVPILIENFDELGPAGQEQIERIVEAAQRLGIEFEGLDQLISLTFSDEEILKMVRSLGVTQAAADALGITLGELQTRVESIFAPETLETLAENFEKTTEEMRAILEDLGIAFQTDLERMAAEVGLTVEDFNALGAAFEAATGIPADQLTAFLEQTGISVADLAEQLGVDITASLGTVGEEVGNTNAELQVSVGLAAQLADELVRAAQAASQINVSIPEVPTTGAQHGYEGRVTGPRYFYVEPGVTEDVSIRKPGRGGEGGGKGVNYTFSPTINLVPGTTEQQAEQIIAIVEQNINGAKDRLNTALE